MWVYIGLQEVSASLLYETSSVYKGKGDIV